MKKFNFSLNNVLNIQEKILSALQIDYANILQSISEQKYIIEQLKNELSEINREYTQKNIIGMAVLEVSMYKNFFKAKHYEIEKEIKKLLSFEQQLEDKRVEITAVNIEISSIEKLKDKKYKEYLSLVKKSEELFVEEFVMQTR